MLNVSTDTPRSLTDLSAARQLCTELNTPTHPFVAAIVRDFVSVAIVGHGRAGLAVAVHLAPAFVLQQHIVNYISHLVPGLPLIRPLQPQDRPPDGHPVGLGVQVSSLKSSICGEPCLDDGQLAVLSEHLPGDLFLACHGGRAYHPPMNREHLERSIRDWLHANKHLLGKRMSIDAPETHEAASGLLDTLQAEFEITPRPPAPLHGTPEYRR